MIKIHYYSPSPGVRHEITPLGTYALLIRDVDRNQLHTTQQKENIYIYELFIKCRRFQTENLFELLSNRCYYCYTFTIFYLEINGKRK